MSKKFSHALLQAASAATIVVALAAAAQAADETAASDRFTWAFSGEATAGVRHYTEGSPYPDWLYHVIPGLNEDDFIPFVSGEVRAVGTSADKHHKLTFEANARYDFSNERGQADISEANYLYDAGNYSVLAGVHTEIWGVTESRHLVDVLNSVQYNGDPLDNDRLGQPMLKLTNNTSWGTFAVYGLFGFREPNLDEAADRLPLDWAINDDSAHYEDGDWRHLAFAARYSNTVGIGGGSLDYALSGFTGTARTPRLVPEFSWGENPPLYLSPNYDHIDQVGAEMLYTYQGLQLKFEGIYRRQNGENVYAATTGAEYTFSDVFASNVDVGLLAEYLYDSRDDTLEISDWQDGANPDYIASNSVFLGARLGMNNAYNTSLLAGVFLDVEDSAKIWAFDLSTLITDNLKVSLKGRFFEDIPDDSIYYFYNKEDYIELSLTHFF